MRRPTPLRLALAPAVTLALALSCASTPRLATRLAAPPAELPEWRPLAEGVRTAAWDLVDPPRRVRALRVELGAPGLEVAVTEGDGRPGGTRGRTTRAFAEERGCVAAVNASPFFPSSDIDGEPRTLVGVSVSAGVLVSPPDPKYWALVFYRDGRARIVDQARMSGSEGVLNAVGGFRPVLLSGAVVGDRGLREPRTAVGLSGDGSVLYALTIDGRQASSAGASLEETGAWLAFLGARDGLNLDGGGSTSMALREGGGSPRLANVPVHGRRPGAERVVGNNLGFAIR